MTTTNLQGRRPRSYAEAFGRLGDAGGGSGDFMRARDFASALERGRIEAQAQAEIEREAATDPDFLKSQGF